MSHIDMGMTDRDRSPRAAGTGGKRNPAEKNARAARSCGSRPPLDELARRSDIRRASWSSDLLSRICYHDRTLTSVARLELLEFSHLRSRRDRGDKASSIMRLGEPSRVPIQRQPDRTPARATSAPALGRQRGVAARQRRGCHSLTDENDEMCPATPSASDNGTHRRTTRSRGSSVILTGGVWAATGGTGSDGRMPVNPLLPSKFARLRTRSSRGRSEIVSASARVSGGAAWTVVGGAA